MTGGDNAYYLPEPSTAKPGTLEFSWPESGFKGGDGYDGPELASMPPKVTVILQQPQGGDNSNKGQAAQTENQ